jgi:hypothetical protein
VALGGKAPLEFLLIGLQLPGDLPVLGLVHFKVKTFGGRSHWFRPHRQI